ncbi:MAG: hypothetical protein JXQ80_12910 [Bacteroidales bacterium]|nr:hypothetical protein [Bacteroidales bacterium]
MTQEQIAKFFAKRPNLKKFWLVNDSLIFLSEERANAHGGKIEVIVKGGKEAKVESTQEEIDAALLELSGLELDEKSDYNVLKKLATILGVEVTGNKKANYLDALKTLKENLGNESGAGSPEATE